MQTIEHPTSLKLDQIILATDFRPNSEAATNYARTLAEHFSATTTVVNVIDLSMATGSEASMAGWPLEDMRRDSAEKMSSTLNKFISSSLKVLGRKVESYNPALAIVDLAEQINADLIVMGTHSPWGLSKMICGSCADGVIHHAGCPVVALGPKSWNQPKKEFQLETIVLATDLWHDADQKVAKAFALAQASASKVYICHVLEESGKESPGAHAVPAALESSLRDLLPDSTFEHTPECIVEFGNAGERILELANRTSADLIVLGARHGGSYASHWKRGVVSAVLAEAQCPVMTICAD
jgi:nucleotide-binding universal stress UspA family protein